MKELYTTYEDNYKTLCELEQDDIERSLRLFNIRIRLAIDIEISFKGNVSLTKTPAVKETYVLIIQLMELWNAYEALSHYVSEVSDHIAKKAGKSKIFTQTFLKIIGSLSILEQAINEIKTNYQVDKFKKDFNTYIDKVKDDARLSKTLKEDAESIRMYAKNEKDISGIEILSLIYAERNMYYHNGETAKMGMSYSNRKKLISIYKKALLQHTLTVANAIITEQTEASI